MSSPELDKTFTKPIRRTLFVADLKCYLCGSVTGSIESQQSLTDAGRSGQPVALRRPGQTSSTSVLETALR